MVWYIADINGFTFNWPVVVVGLILMVFVYWRSRKKKKVEQNGTSQDDTG